MDVKPTLFRVLRYGMTGGVAAIVDLSVFSALCPAALPAATAATISFLFAAIVNYALTTVVVFRAEYEARNFAKFLAFAVVGLGLNVGVTVLTVNVFSVHPVFAKTIGIGVAFLFNFWLNATFVFAAKGSRSRASMRIYPLAQGKPSGATD